VSYQFEDYDVECVLEEAYPTLVGQFKEAFLEAILQ